MSVARLAIEHGQRIQNIEIMADSAVPVRIVAVRLQFESICVCISVNAMDDTIVLSDDWPKNDDDDEEACANIEVRKISWSVLAAATLTWAWRMENNLGYVDGVQLEFRQEGQPSAICIQFIAAASALRVRMVQSLSATALWE
jgi:hypothetical protein